jgi:hypothetical protein
MTIQAETMSETRPLGRLGELLRAAFSGPQTESDWLELPRPTRQEKLLHAARTACVDVVEW